MCEQKLKKIKDKTNRDKYLYMSWFVERYLCFNVRAWLSF